MTFRQYFQYLHKNESDDPLTKDATTNANILEDFNTAFPGIIKIRELHKERDLLRLREAMETREVARQMKEEEAFRKVYRDKTPKQKA